jgi:hypothetical protein
MILSGLGAEAPAPAAPAPAKKPSRAPWIVLGVVVLAVFWPKITKALAGPREIGLLDD